MTTKLQITGMTCGHCEAAVKKALEEVPGVTEVTDVSKDREQAVVEGEVSADALISAVAEEGYEARVV